VSDMGSILLMRALWLAQLRLKHYLMQIRGDRWGHGLTIRLHPTVSRLLVKSKRLLAAGEAGRYISESSAGFLA
jgi:hypothetical protein